MSSKRRNITPTVQIKGPLGELSMTIPSYLKIDHDVTSRKATVSVLDAQERQQREMWGMRTDIGRKVPGTPRQKS